MPPALTFSRGFTAWTADWSTLVIGVVALAAYLAAARRGAWPARRTISFVLGVAAALVCTCSFLGVYDDVLFWTRAVQNVVLLMGVPLLLAMGAPITLLMRSVGPRTADVLRGVGHSRFARGLSFPLTVTVILLVPMPVLYLSGIYEQTLRHGGVDFVIRAVLVACGFVYYWTRLQIDPTPKGATHLVSFGISFAETLVDGVLGVIVWLGPLMAHGYYLSVARDWGPSLRQDQTMGAVALWFGGDAIGIPYLVALFVQWFRDEDRAAKRIDAELDRQERLRLARERAGAATAGEAAAPGPGMQSGLWWESDPRLAGRPGFGRAPKDTDDEDAG